MWTTRLAFCLTLSFLSAPMARAQERAEPQTRGTGTVSGRVTREGKAAPGVGVMVAKDSSMGGRNDTVAKGTTAKDGTYRLDGIPTGSYVVLIDAPGFVLKGLTSSRTGKSLSLSDGEVVENFDLDVERGGVITGRIATEGNRPLVGQEVSLYRVESDGTARPFNMLRWGGRRTDDRGVYRVYGLPPGKYYVAAGTADDPYSMTFGQAKRYPLTYHPASSSEAQARAVEITSGGEATGVDILMPKAERLFEAAGRFVQAGTDKPAAGVSIAYGHTENGQFVGLFGSVGKSIETGEFRITGLKPGTYGVYGEFDEGEPYYITPVAFTIASSNVTDLTVPVHVGTTISGVVQFEGGGAQEGVKLEALWISFGYEPDGSGLQMRSGPGAKVAADGTFAATGAWPGRVTCSIGPWDLPRKPTVLRVERDGAPLAGPLEVVEGEPVTGLKVVVAFGTGTIRGQTKVTGAATPNGRGRVTVRRAESNSISSYALPDARGQFVVTNLPAGDYNVVLDFYEPEVNRRYKHYRSAPKSVTVPEGSSADVTVDLVVGEESEVRDGR